MCREQWHSPRNKQMFFSSVQETLQLLSYLSSMSVGNTQVRNLFTGGALVVVVINTFLYCIHPKDGPHVSPANMLEWIKYNLPVHNGGVYSEFLTFDSKHQSLECHT